LWAGDGPHHTQLAERKANPKRLGAQGPKNTAGQAMQSPTGKFPKQGQVKA